jgi:lysophospholipase L1-like esterase
VSNSGSSSAAVLNFTIPQGAAGATGGGIPVVNPVVMDLLGDSITNCYLINSGCANPLSYPARLARAAGIANPNNWSASGAQACDAAGLQLLNHYAASAQQQQPYVGITIGTNDANSKGAGPYEVTFNACVNAIQAHVTAVTKVAASTGTTSGTCANDTTYSQLTGENCTSSGATIAVTITTGTTAYILYRSIDGDAGTWNWKVNSGATTAVTTAATTAINTINGTTTAPFAIRVSGLTAGSNVFTFTKTNASGNMPILEVVSHTASGAAKAAPYIVQTSVPNQLNGTDQTAVNAYNTDIAADVAQIQADGGVVYAPIFQNSMLATTAAGDMANTLHPNVYGNGEMANAVLNTVSIRPGASSTIMSCQQTFGDGVNVITAASYPAVTCYNDTNSPWTITAVRCRLDSGSSTCNAVANTAGNLLTGAVTGTTGWANGTLNGYPVLQPGDWITLTFGADGTSKSITVDVVGEII